MLGKYPLPPPYTHTHHNISRSVPHCFVGDLGDAVENRAIKEVFNDHVRNLKLSSTKGELLKIIFMIFCF